MSSRFPFTIVAIVLFFPSTAFASCNLDYLVGYTLAAKKTVAAYIEKGVRKDEFEGCDFDRVLVFDDDTGVACLTYSYSYSYRPTAYIFVKGGSMKACIADSLYDVGPLR